ncbi:MAG: hypothetical protein A2934_04755 [Candidatus Sungbacteria bacterium RIFCSPLOWO2_01_FULL_47_10]|uniref:Uncharacterized protein n=1 Tax=Candidatus Sungbacteria bacterium RIFCSPLOWO2_01_FULL_47_10 TaxID=1802276 RepID=A0A1G2L6Z8_9BACT|nr:MAG: hypothetical protein A2934_04755 [Candidatus Sungbacteria bacterium RIFCSPLOWO2_01_FULL_47_10]
MDAKKKKIMIRTGGGVVIASLLFAVFFLIARNQSQAPSSPFLKPYNDRELPSMPLVLPKNNTTPAESNEPKNVSQTSKLPPYSGFPVGIIHEDPAVAGIYPEETKNKLAEELSGLAALLSENPDSLDSWLRAGVIKKFFGDYAGARDAWEYAGVVSPLNFVSFFNLGGLYAYYLKDNKKAELNYFTAIENGSNDPMGYTALADFYKDAYPEKSGSVPGVIEKGIAANPTETGLPFYLANYYKNSGEISKAIEYFEKVLLLDPGNSIAASELETLKNQ